MTCMKEKIEKLLWGHHWTLCIATQFKRDAEACKNMLIQKGKIARLQYASGESLLRYYVWYR